jgi:hypothetical protein
LFRRAADRPGILAPCGKRFSAVMSPHVLTLLQLHRLVVFANVETAESLIRAILVPAARGISMSVQVIQSDVLPYT